MSDLQNQEVNTEAEDVIFVERYGMFEFLKAIQENFRKGYEMDFDCNHTAPTSYGIFHVVGMKKVKEAPKQTKSKKTTGKEAE